MIKSNSLFEPMYVVGILMHSHETCCITKSKTQTAVRETCTLVQLFLTAKLLLRGLLLIATCMLNLLPDYCVTACHMTRNCNTVSHVL